MQITTIGLDIAKNVLPWRMIIEADADTVRRAITASLNAFQLGQ